MLSDQNLCDQEARNNKKCVDPDVTAGKAIDTEMECDSRICGLADSKAASPLNKIGANSDAMTCLHCHGVYFDPARLLQSSSVDVDDGGRKDGAQ